MTIIEAIAIIDSVKPNGYSQSDKIRWLSKLDGKVKEEIIDAHEGGENKPFSGYNDNTDLETKLLIDETYTDIYRYWLEAQIDYANAEYGKYNNSITTYNAVYDSYAKAYHRKNMPKTVKLSYF